MKIRNESKTPNFIKFKTLIKTIFLVDKQKSPVLYWLLQKLLISWYFQTLSFFTHVKNNENTKKNILMNKQKKNLLQRLEIVELN